MAHVSGKCPRCCPDRPLAIFKRDYREVEQADGSWEYEWRYFCSNCGYGRKPKAPRKVALKDYSTDTFSEEELAKLNRWSLARYHLLNPNGMIKGDLQRLHDRIERNADLLKAAGKPGFILVYGFRGYHGDKLGELAFAKKVKLWDVRYHVAKLREQIDNGNRELDELGAAR